MITLEPITSANLEECLRLALPPEQQGFLRPNAVSLAQAYVDPRQHPRLGRAGTDAVGFVLFGPHPDDGRPWLRRLMVDHRHQGRGHGRRLLAAAVLEARAILGADDLLLSCRRDNPVALALYRSAGFADAGETADGRAILRLDLGRG
jgi:diamine N-acetyltransferase